MPGSTNRVIETRQTGSGLQVGREAGSRKGNRLRDALGKAVETPSATQSRWCSSVHAANESRDGCFTHPRWARALQVELEGNLGCACQGCVRGDTSTVLARGSRGISGERASVLNGLVMDGRLAADSHWECRRFFSLAGKTLKDFPIAGVSPEKLPQLYRLQGNGRMHYRYEAAGLEGLVARVAQLAGHGYCFFVLGRVPAGKCAAAIDEKLLRKYGVALSRDQRYRRKRRGEAALHYVRWENHFVLLATHGRHPFFHSEQSRLRDLRETPLRLGGYSISLRAEPGRGKRFRAAVRLDKETFRLVRDRFLENAVHRRAESIAAAIWSLPFEPYRPIRKQLFRVLSQVNDRRKRAGFEPVPRSCIRWKHRQGPQLATAEEESINKRLAN